MSKKYKKKDFHPLDFFTYKGSINAVNKGTQKILEKIPRGCMAIIILLLVMACIINNIGG